LFEALTHNRLSFVTLGIVSLMFKVYGDGGKSTYCDTDEGKYWTIKENGTLNWVNEPKGRSHTGAYSIKGNTLTNEVSPLDG